MHLDGPRCSCAFRVPAGVAAAPIDDVLPQIVLSVALCFLCVGMFGSYSEKRRSRHADTVRQRDMAYAETQANGGVPVTAGYARARRGIFSS